MASLYDASSSTSNPDLLGHPLGYPILLSFVYRLRLTRILQHSSFRSCLILCGRIIFPDRPATFPTAVGVIAGLMAAFAPQFSWNSILLLPDSLAALPILLAMLMITRRVGQAFHVGHTFLPVQSGEGFNFTKMDRQECLSYLAAGALIGVSCWFRANALLLAPFVALSFPIIFKNRGPWRRALVLSAALFCHCAAHATQCDRLR